MAEPLDPNWVADEIPPDPHIDYDATLWAEEGSQPQDSRGRGRRAVADFYRLEDAQRVADAVNEVEALRAFKAYVHERLDRAGVPTHPSGPHSKEGCRVGDRLDILIEERDAARAELAEKQKECNEEALRAARLVVQSESLRVERDAERRRAEAAEHQLAEALARRHHGEALGLKDLYVTVPRRIASLEAMLRTALRQLDTWGHDRDCAVMRARRGHADPVAFCNCNIENTLREIRAILVPGASAPTPSDTCIADREACVANLEARLEKALSDRNVWWAAHKNTVDELELTKAELTKSKRTVESLSDVVSHVTAERDTLRASLERVRVFLEDVREWASDDHVIEYDDGDMPVRRAAVELLAALPAPTKEPAKEVTGHWGACLGPSDHEGPCPIPKGVPAGTKCLHGESPLEIHGRLRCWLCGEWLEPKPEAT